MSITPTGSERYQAGHLEKKGTSSGPCWYVRFRVYGQDGKLQRPRFRIGTLRALPTKAAASRAAEALRSQFNSKVEPSQVPRLMVSVIERYVAEELPPRFSTGKAYRGLLYNHILPKWGNVTISDIRAQAVREWLRSLPLSTKTRGHIRDMIRTLFRFAMLWEWIPLTDNPMSLFRLERSSRRVKEPRILSPEEFAQLVAHPLLIVEPYRTMVLLAACTGLRSSEIFGLQWGDVRWEENSLRVERASVQGRVDDVKTIYSAKPLPLHQDLLLVLRGYFRRTEFQHPTDWIFASPHTAGEKTYHAERIQQYRIARAARELGLGTGIGWHTFRHSYRAWLGRTKVDVGVQRDLMRHANISTTMNVYGGSFVDDMREANDGVIKLVLQ